MGWGFLFFSFLISMIKVFSKSNKCKEENNKEEDYMGHVMRT